MNQNSKNSHTKYWVIVSRLEDVVPRRDPRKENLYLSVSTQEPKIAIHSLIEMKGPIWTRGHVRGLKEMTRTGPFLTREKAKKRKELLSKRLKEEGFTVNRDLSIWRVYVIELDPTAVKNPGKGNVYVGQTSKAPEQRFAEHTRGMRNKNGPLFSRVVFKHGIRLRPDLASEKPFFSEALSKRGEQECFQRLKSHGYHPEGGH